MVGVRVVISSLHLYSKEEPLSLVEAGLVDCSYVEWFYRSLQNYYAHVF
jgi:hypothetical protein